MTDDITRFILGQKFHPDWQMPEPVAIVAAKCRAAGNRHGTIAQGGNKKVLTNEQLAEYIKDVGNHF